MVWYGMAAPCLVMSSLVARMTSGRWEMGTHTSVARPLHRVRWPGGQVTRWPGDQVAR